MILSEDIQREAGRKNRNLRGYDRNVVVTSKIATAVKLLIKRKSIKPGCSIHG